MARHKPPRPHAKAETIQEIRINDLLEQAAPAGTGLPLYANHVQLHATTNETLLDFYLLGPTPTGETVMKASHVQRIVIPPSLLKGLTTALANLVDSIEAKTGTSLPLGRPKQPEDRIELWKE